MSCVGGLCKQRDCEMQVSSGRALSWIVARAGAKQGLKSAGVLPHRSPGRTFLSVGLQQQRQWPWRLFSRALSTVPGGGIDDQVLHSLRDEIRSLKSANVVREVKPPEPFVLRKKPGGMDVVLQREYEQERINVDCELLLQPQDEDDDSGPHVLLINLTITITKGGPEALEISCQCHGDEYFINYISFHEDFSKQGHDHTVHEKQLSEDLKHEFLYFLFFRGFDDEMAVFLHHYLEKKRNEERITNLENVAAVLANQTL